MKKRKDFDFEDIEKFIIKGAYFFCLKLIYITKKGLEICEKKILKRIKEK